MAKKVIYAEVVMDTSSAEKNVDGLTDSIKGTKKEVKETGDATGGLTGSLDKLTGGAVSGFKAMRGGIKKVVGGFKSMKVAIAATGIGLLLIAILALKTAFTSSEEGQNKFAKIMGVIGSITGNLIDLLANLGESIISVFENPKQALIDFKDAFVENITNRISSAIETIGFLGSAIKKVFSADFDGAMEDAKKAGSSYVDTLTGVKNTLDKVSESVVNFANEITKEAKIAGNIADQRAKADKLERSLIVERAEANRKRAELLEKAVDKDKFNAKQRIEFLTEAGRIEEEITAKEIRAARLRFEAKVEENKLSKSTKEDLTDEANLKAKLIDLETARLTKAKLVTSQITAAKREQQALEDEEKKLRLEKEAQDLADSNAVIKSAADEKKKILKDAADEEIKIAKAVEQQKKDIQNASINAISKGISFLSAMAGKNKKLQATAILGESAVGIAKTVISTRAANAGALATPQAILTSGASAIPVIAANTVSGALSIAANIAATSKALKALKAGGSPTSSGGLGGGGGRGGSFSGKPSGDANNFFPTQIGAIPQNVPDVNATPIKAYVVASDIADSTRAQEILKQKSTL